MDRPWNPLHATAIRPGCSLSPSVLRIFLQALAGEALSGARARDAWAARQGGGAGGAGGGAIKGVAAEHSKTSNAMHFTAF